MGLVGTSSGAARKPAASERAETSSVDFSIVFSCLREMVSVGCRFLQTSPLLSAFKFRGERAYMNQKTKPPEEEGRGLVEERLPIVLLEKIFIENATFVTRHGAPLLCGLDHALSL
jgi:hypothetical protein